MYTTSIAVQVLPDVTETEKVLAIVDKVIAYITAQVITMWLALLKPPLKAIWKV